MGKRSVTFPPCFITIATAFVLCREEWVAEKIAGVRGVKEEDRKEERERESEESLASSSCLASFYQSRLLPAQNPRGL